MCFGSGLLTGSASDGSVSATMPTGATIVAESTTTGCRKTVWNLAGTAAAFTSTDTTQVAYSDGYKVTSGMTMIANTVPSQLWSTCVTAAADNKADATSKMGAICHVARASGSTATAMALGGHQVSWLSSTVWVPGSTTTTATADTMVATTG